MPKKTKTPKTFIAKERKSPIMGRFMTSFVLLKTNVEIVVTLAVCFFFVLFLFFISSPLLRKSRPKSFLPFFYSLFFPFGYQHFLAAVSCFHIIISTTRPINSLNRSSCSNYGALHIANLVKGGFNWMFHLAVDFVTESSKPVTPLF